MVEHMAWQHDIGQSFVEVVLDIAYTRGVIASDSGQGKD